MGHKSDESRVSIEGLRTEHFTYLGEINGRWGAIEVGKFMNVL
jgi:hypothetical protein